MGLVISKRRRPDSPFASSQCHSVVLQPRLPVSPPLLSASTHTRSTLQGFRSRIAPQTAPSPPLSLPREPRKAARLHTAPLHRGAIGLSVSSPFELVGDTELEPKSGAPTDRAFLRGSPSHSVYREEASNGDGSPCRGPIFLSNRSRGGDVCSILEATANDDCCSI